QCQTGKARLIVDQNSASATLAAIATGFRSGQADEFPQIVQQQDAFRYTVAACAAVERESENARHTAPIQRFPRSVFCCADSISVAAIRFKPVIAANVHRDRLRFAAELATASRGIVGALNKKADTWRR